MYFLGLLYRWGWRLFLCLQERDIDTVYILFPKAPFQGETLLGHWTWGLSTTRYRGALSALSGWQELHCLYWPQSPRCSPGWCSTLFPPHQVETQTVEISSQHSVHQGDKQRCGRRTLKTVLARQPSTDWSSYSRMLNNFPRLEHFLSELDFLCCCCCFFVCLFSYIPPFQPLPHIVHHPWTPIFIII